MERRNLLKSVSLGGVAAAAGVTPAFAAEGDLQARANHLLDRMIEAINRHDVSILDEVYAVDGYVNHQTLVTMGGNTPATTGRAQAKNYFGARIKAFPDITLATDIRTGSGDLIAANLVWRGTHQGDYLGIPATGRKVAWNSTDILRVRGNYFVEHWGAVDMLGLQKQLKG